MDSNTLIEGLHFYNPWWETKGVPPELLKDYRRPVVQDILSYLELERIVILKGARRTGKTTIFYQLISELIKKGISPHDILFISFDDIKMRVDLDDLLKTYQQINRRLINEGTPVYIFMDEVQFLDQWQFSIKKYFDRKYPLKFLVSGSAATLIKKGSESLAGRTIEETVYPFSFYEFLCLVTRKPKLIDAVNRLRADFTFGLVDITDLAPYLAEIRIAFEEYIEKGGIPSLFGINEPLLWKRLAREDIIEKVIYRDLVELYDIKKPEALERLFLYLSGITSQILSVANISNSLGLSREYTEKYIVYLEQAYLVRRLNKYAGSVEKTIRSAQKVHLPDSGLINAVSKVAMGNVVESMAASHLFRKRDERVYYYRDRYEVDLVAESPDGLLPIEVKFTDTIEKRDLKGIESFHEKFHTDKAVVVSRELLEERSVEGRRTVFLPAWLFMLMTG